TGHDAKHSDAAEEMERPGQVTEHEANGDEIEEHAERSRDAVMTGSLVAIDVLDRDFADGRAVARGQGRNEAVHLAVKRNLLQQFTTVGFVGRPEIVD